MCVRYYPALRTLEQLEQTCLPRAGQYRFCSIMAENIPKLRIQIRDTAMSQLRDFLESIRKHSDKIGETAIKQVHRAWSLRYPQCNSAAGSSTQVIWFHLLKCEYFLVSALVYDSKLNIFKLGSSCTWLTFLASSSGVFKQNIWFIKEENSLQIN